jgi:hypothetical protein
MADQQPILVTPGQSVGEGDWSALFAQHGGFKSVQSRAPTKAEQESADDTGADLTQSPIYRYYLADGTFVEAKTAANGADYQIIAYQPSQKFQQAQARGQKDTDWHPEGTPDGQGGYDNTRPIMARTVNGAKETRAPTSAELKDWNEAQQRSRNPNGLTDAEVQSRQPQTVKAPVKDQPGFFEVTTKNPVTGQTETHYEDASGKTVNQPGTGGKVKTPVKDRPGIYEVTTKDPTTNVTETHFEDEAGNKVAAPTAAPTPVSDGHGGYGVWDTSSGSPVWKPIAGGPQAPLKPEQVNGVWGVWQPSKTGGAPTFQPIDVPAAGKTFKNVDPYQPDFNAARPRHWRGRTKQRQKIGLPPSRAVSRRPTTIRPPSRRTTTPRLRSPT